MTGKGPKLHVNSVPVRAGPNHFVAPFARERSEKSKPLNAPLEIFAHVVPRSRAPNRCWRCRSSLNERRVIRIYLYERQRRPDRPQGRAMKDQVPTPGSTAAKDQGCTCDVYDNNHGQYAPRKIQGLEAWWVTKGCPLHDRKNRKNEPRTNMRVRRQRADAHRLHRPVLQWRLQMQGV